MLFERYASIICVHNLIMQRFQSWNVRDIIPYYKQMSCSNLLVYPYNSTLLPEIIFDKQEFTTLLYNI